MEGSGQIARERVEVARDQRITRALMFGGALILFVLGLWLLIEPSQAGGATARDNVMAGTAYSSPCESAAASARASDHGE